MFLSISQVPIYQHSVYSEEGREWSESRYKHSPELMLVSFSRKKFLEASQGLPNEKTGLVPRDVLRAVFTSQREPRSCFLRRTSTAVPQQ